MTERPGAQAFTLCADYHQFYVLDESAPLDATGSQDFWTREAFERKLAAGRRILGVVTGTSGDVPVVLELANAGPPDDLDAWDHVVDAPLELPSGTLILCGCTQPREEGHRARVAPGQYRVRVYYGGLDSVVDEIGDDHYRIVVWPGDSAEPRVLKGRPRLST